MRFDQPQAVAVAPAAPVIIQVPGAVPEAVAMRTHRGVELSLDGDADVISSAPRAAADGNGGAGSPSGGSGSSGVVAAGGGSASGVSSSGSLRAAPQDVVGNTGMRSAPASRARAATRAHRGSPSSSGGSLGKAVAILLILAAAGFAAFSYLDKGKQAARDHDAPRPTSPAKGKGKR